MPEIEGILESYEIIKGLPSRNFQDLKIIVGGLEFYRTLWVPSKKLLRRYGRKIELKKFVDLFTYDESFPKKEFFKDVNNNIGKKVRVSYEDIEKAWVYYGWDRLHGIYVPRKHREILDLDFIAE